MQSGASTASIWSDFAATKTCRFRRDLDPVLQRRELDGPSTTPALTSILKLDREPIVVIHQLEKCRRARRTSVDVLKTTQYFDAVVLRKRPYIRLEWCEQILANPLRREVQPDGRIRFWGRVPEFGGRVFRVVTLSDGETVHNAFPDRGYVVRDNGREQDG